MASKDKTTKKLKNTSSLKKQAKLQEKLKLTPNLNKFLQEEYYSKTPGTKRPLVYTGKNSTNAFGQKVKNFNEDYFINKYPDFPLKEMKIKTSEEARKVFDEVHYPLVSHVPKDRQQEIGIMEAIPSYINGKKNCIRYYTKNKKLTQAQCDILYREEDQRSVHGYLINDKHMSTEMLLDYLAKVEKYDKIKAHITEDNVEASNIRAIQELGKNIRTLRAIKEIAPTVPTNPDGSREPQYIGMGIKSKMEKFKLKNPTGLIDVQAKAKPGDKYEVPSYDVLGRVLNEINVYPQEAFDYICKYLNRYKDIKRKHTEERETQRGGSALKILIDFFNGKKKSTTLQRLEDGKTRVYTYTDLMNSKEYDDYCNTTGETKLSKYNTFKDWCKKKIDFINNINKKK